MKSLPIRLLWATGGGIIASLSFPQPGIGLLMFIGLPMMVFAFRGTTLWRGVLLGLVAGFVYYGNVARWLTIYLGIVPWLGLVGMQAIFFAIGGALLVAAWRGADRLNLHSFRGILSAGVLVAAAWTAREAIAAQFPWGGFAWARVSHSQADTPFRYLATLFGMSGASAVLVLATVSVILVAQWGGSRKSVILRIAAVVASVSALLPVPYLMLASSANGSFRVAAVQGNSDSALFSMARQGDAIRNHFDVMNAVSIGRVDAVVWPENAMDINPLANDRAAAFADLVSTQAGAPFIFGTITTDGAETFNSALMWEEGRGAVDQYDKVHPVPFAEYLPARDFFYPLAPDLFDMVPRDYTLGTRDPIFEFGKVRAGIAICYDIVDDGLFRSMLAQNANVIIAPTNNSDFGRTDENIQQLGIARMRAVETGRAVVNTSTVGVSAVIAPDGSDIDRLTPFEPGVMVADVPLSTLVTPASIIGLPLEWALIIGGVTPVVAPLFRRRARND
ncbi:MAG: apolipoprotein N-acyltransferase [Microbacteriaceae bacterium]